MNCSNDNLVDRLPKFGSGPDGGADLGHREPAAIWRSAGPISGPVGGEYAE
jgi:hypothetical protein